MTRRGADCYEPPNPGDATIIDALLGHPFDSHPSPT
jgi:hypothetical protein